MAGTHLLSTRSTPASVGTTILALGVKLHSRVDMLIAATSLSTSECRVEACGGRWSSRSRLRAADPLPTVQSPSAGSRAPLVGAIGGTWDVVTELDAHSVFLAWLGQSAMLRCLESSGRCRPLALVLVALKWPWIVLLNM